MPSTDWATQLESNVVRTIIEIGEKPLFTGRAELDNRGPLNNSERPLRYRLSVALANSHRRTGEKGSSVGAPKDRFLYECLRDTHSKKNPARL